jgi:hypothetical protein
VCSEDPSLKIPFSVTVGETESPGRIVAGGTQRMTCELKSLSFSEQEAEGGKKGTDAGLIHQECEVGGSAQWTLDQRH